MTSFIRVLELAGVKHVPTIRSATEPSGNINRRTADRIIDPRGYFAQNKRKLGKRSMFREVLQQVIDERRPR